MLRAKPAEPRQANLSPASPEVISSLITSLSVISKPASNHFEGPAVNLSAPGSPRQGSFGVDYGAYSQPSHDEEFPQGLSLDELAASPRHPNREAAVGVLAPHRSQVALPRTERLQIFPEDRVPTIIQGPASASRPDPFLAETPITEESHEAPRRDLGPNEADGARVQEGLGKKFTLKRDSDAPSDTIHEGVEHSRARGTATDKPLPVLNRDPEVTVLKHPAPQNLTTTTITRDFPSSSSSPTPAKPQRPHAPHYRSPSNSRLEGINIHPHSGDEPENDDFAPFPSVAQGRRRDASYDRGRRRSGQLTPDPLEGMGIKPKRSNSKLKRASGALSPRASEDRYGGNRSRLSSPEPSPGLPGYERPRSADSIDDAVESYLCSPRLSQKIRHPQTGRVISFSEVGDSEGSAVFCCVGMGLTRYITAFYDELALTLKLRLITPDRPGVGDSEAYADGTATPLSWPDDVYAICQALKINKFSILAHSAGAIYALATALRMPQHIRGRIHLLAPWIPPSQMNVFGTSQTQPPTNAIPTSQRILRALPTPILKAANSSFMSATSSSITSSLPKNPRRSKRKSTNSATRTDAPTLTGSQQLHGLANQDKENFGHNGPKTGTNSDLPSLPMATENMDLVKPEGPQGARIKPTDRAVINMATNAVADKERQMTYDTRLTHAIWELATTGANPAVDLLVCLERRHTIGFRYVDITRPVVIHHGSRDTRVPVENVRWLGKTMRRCEVRVLEGEGHGLMASATVMGSVLMEISKEWEDWMRVTGTSRTRSGDRGGG
ncbi:unnamed protein product [Parascedosporium putredinis]|uniref:AB hydrolase-1 domain-containing protein n=1 Tax=Parascedosporium putredinis TaxID=1442378 RepID=A0A9P1M6C5_9PEZI|nr:unnamed protein product [Parascedosporium putredinis]CAI7989451.1 unnamed protein product [Parascedosporium putredinis]